MLPRLLARNFCQHLKAKSPRPSLINRRLHTIQQHVLPKPNAPLAGLRFATCRPHSSSFSAPPEDPLGSALLDLVTYEAVSSETLESLCEYFDQLVEASPHLKNADITFSDGVLTIHFGSKHGTYVINRQSPNRQIWLSSPTSGPKRYDFVPTNDVAGATLCTNGMWVYRHDGRTLHELLQDEIGLIVRRGVDFVGLPHGGGDDKTV